MIPVEDNRITVYLESLGRPVSVGLLTGSTRAKVRRELIQLSLEGNLDLLVGTHALIQSGVEIPQLALAVMDEQHRFGVMQRSALRQKGVENPHILVMSATPIPRTLSLTLYGDLDISTIDELPPGRQKIQTRWLGPDRRDAAHGFVRKQVQEGRQAFVIYPLIDESEAVQAKAAIEEHKRLSRDVFPDFKVGLLHGRMSGKDKDKVMRQFRDGGLDILVSTSVVEVGIDVANATVMMIEGADRFGLPIGEFDNVLEGHLAAPLKRHCAQQLNQRVHPLLMFFLEGDDYKAFRVEHRHVGIGPPVRSRI